MKKKSAKRKVMKWIDYLPGDLVTVFKGKGTAVQGKVKFACYKDRHMTSLEIVFVD